MLSKVSNPPNPFSRYSVEWLDVLPEAKLEVFEERAKSIISKNDSPDIGYRYSMNPYRGCFHACAYCYARSYHPYLDFGAGTDFEKKLVVKRNAPELLERAFMKPSWKGDMLHFSGSTDCYQPLEANYELAKCCLEVCLRFRNPVSIITKGGLIRRDLELLGELAERAEVQVYFSIAFAEDLDAKLLEPGAPRPSTRFRAMEELSKAGISVGVSLAPIMPGLNDRDIAMVLSRARDCGAKTAFLTPLRLPQEMQDVFLERLYEILPAKADKIVNGIKSIKGGQLNISDFGSRMGGSGPRWEAIAALFHAQCRKLGISCGEVDSELYLSKTTFRRPREQLSLF